MTPTVVQIRERIEAIMALAPGNLTKVDRYADPNEPIPDNQVPFFFVGRAGRAEHQTGNEMFTSRRFLVWIGAAEVLDDTIGSEEAGDDAAEALIDPIIWYLNQHRHLELDGTDEGLSGVQGISIKDDGVKQKYTRSTKTYSALAIMIDVGTNRSS